MIVHGLPGSLVELLKPVRQSAEKQGLYPADFAELQKASLNDLIKQIHDIYRQENTIYSFNHERGTEGEFHFVSVVSSQVNEGHLFNNMGGIPPGYGSGGLLLFPDHVLLTPTTFLYVETKNWTANYMERNKARNKEGVRNQMNNTLDTIVTYLRHEGFDVVASCFLYDHGKVFNRVLEGHTVWEDPREAVAFLQGRGSLPPMRKYERIVEHLVNKVCGKPRKGLAWPRGG